jgi:hypothetical protein
MEFWIFLWKATLVVGLGAFGVLAIGVTILGARDIKHLLSTLKAEHDEAE